MSFQRRCVFFRRRSAGEELRARDSRSVADDSEVKFGEHERVTVKSRELVVVVKRKWKHQLDDVLFFCGSALTMLREKVLVLLKDCDRHWVKMWLKHLHKHCRILLNNSSCVDEQSASCLKYYDFVEIVFGFWRFCWLIKFILFNGEESFKAIKPPNQH